MEEHHANRVATESLSWLAPVDQIERTRELDYISQIEDELKMEARKAQEDYAAHH